MDTADEIAPLEELLKTTINRAKIAQTINNARRPDLLATVLEDLYCGAQLILDNYCIKEG